jgi:IS30 family transposase
MQRRGGSLLHGIRQKTICGSSRNVSIRSFTAETKIQVYFADPQSPWQRGTNENTNGLIRQYFPKGTDFHEVSLSEIKKAEQRLNSRPRKALDYYTPSEKFYQLVTGRKVALEA